MQLGGKLWIAPLALLALSGCAGWQSALDPQGPQADGLADLIWIFTAISAVIWLAVMLVVLAAILRRSPDRPDPLTLRVPTERRSVLAIAGATAATLLTVMALTALSYLSQRQLYARQPPAVVVKITGHQWWWDLRYES